jgi:serine/threonine-protein kinase
MLLFFELRAHDRAEAESAWADRAAGMAAGVRSSLELPAEVLEGIRSLIATRPQLTLDEFRRFVRPALARHQSITALEWAPLVDEADRESFEMRAREQGIAGYRITEMATGGTMDAAKRRQQYVPIFYMEPASGAYGFDLISEPGRREIAWEARDQGQPRASGRFQLVEDPPGIYSIAVYLPVYAPGADTKTVDDRKRAFVGFAISVYRLGTLIERALSAKDRKGLDVVLIDRDAPGDDRLLYESKRGFAGSIPAGRIQWRTEFEFAGRRWQLVLVSSEVFQPGALSWISLGVGALLSLLLGGGIGAARTILDLRREVAEALKLGQYTLIEKMGKGGMGSVYRAQHKLLRRPTAIKLLKSTSAVGLKRFKREVQITSQLTHPNTIAIYDYGNTPDGTFYYAMEYLEGISLEELVVIDGAQPASRVVHILKQACGALAEAHAVGLIHRDVKPANLMLTYRGLLYDFVKVLDFGLVKKTEGTDAGVTNVDAVVGTPLYLSPEAIKSEEKLDSRSDLYSLGCVAYFLLTGTDVFMGTSMVDICAKHLRAKPKPMSEHEVSVPEALERLVMLCLAKEPEERPSTATEIADELELLDIPAWTNADARHWWETVGKGVVERAEADREEFLTKTDSQPPSKVSKAIALKKELREPSDDA